MTRKICLLFFSILILIFLFFTVCKKSEQPQKQYTVTFWTLQLNGFENYFNNVITEFEMQNPNTKINWIDIPYSEGEKRVLASLLSNEVPDLINITADFATTLYNKKALSTISPNAVNEFNSSVLKSLKTKNGFVAFPFYATSAVTIYNKAILKKIGAKKIPETYEELNNITKLIKNKTGSFAQMPTLCENDTFFKILNKYGINSPAAYASQKTAEIYSTYRDFYKNNFIPRESITQTHREVLEKYGSGQIVFLQAGANFLNLIKENSPTIYKNTEVTKQLTSPDGKYDVSLMTLAIPQKAKNQEMAMKFAQFLLNEKNQLEFAKLSSILPTNQKTLTNDEFKNLAADPLQKKARKISAAQLNKLQPSPFFLKNKHDIINLINITTQEILLNNAEIIKILEEASLKWTELETS